MNSIGFCLLEQSEKKLSRKISDPGAACELVLLGGDAIGELPSFKGLFIDFNQLGFFCTESAEDTLFEDFGREG